MFELTDTLTYAVPVMLSVLVAKTVADALEPKGIYDLVIELNQLPYLDSKHEYLWGNLQINDVVRSCEFSLEKSLHIGFLQVQRDVPVIRVDEKNTVSSLRIRLLNTTSSGGDDSGFPILQNSVDDNGLRMVGYIGSNELDHALCSYDVLYVKFRLSNFVALIPPDGDDEVHFHATYAHHWASSSISSLQESGPLVQSDSFDLTPYMDQVCLFCSIQVL
jgi:chloride channel 3/4/5